jgi:hypothetical protein
MSMPMPTLNVHLAPASRAHQLPEAAVHDRQLGVYSVEKLLSRVEAIFELN